MGQPKLLLPWGDTTFIGRVLAAWCGSLASVVVVVVRADDAPLAAAVRRTSATLVTPDVAPVDMKASVARGLEWIASHHDPAPHDAWLMAPADMPYIDTPLVDAVIRCHDPRAPRIVVPAFDGRRGHPLLVPWPLAAEVARLAPDAGLNALLAPHPPLEMPWSDARAACDVDAPADYRRLHNPRDPQ